MPTFAPLPDPPYFAVIFTSQRSDADVGYSAMAERMEVLAASQPGYIGMDSARDAQGYGITVSYWRDNASVVAWKKVAEHMLAQKLGRTRWYDRYTLRVAQVERQYEGPEGRGI